MFRIRGRDRKPDPRIVELQEAISEMNAANYSAGVRDGITIALVGLLGGHESLTGSWTHPDAFPGYVPDDVRAWAERALQRARGAVVTPARASEPPTSRRVRYRSGVIDDGRTP